MIFVTLGSQKFQFDRLLRALDELLEEGVIADTIFAQTGASTYTPKNYEYIPFMDREAFAAAMDKADLVITHAGTGAIISAVKKGKKVIAVPRLAKYGEHVDDHQIQIVNQFKDMNLIMGVYSCDDLAEALHSIKNVAPPVYVSNTNKIITSIEEFLEGIING